MPAGASPVPAGAPAPASTDAPPPAEAPVATGLEVVQLTPGDQVKMECFNRPEMTTAAYVEANGTLRLPLVGAVQVGSLSPAEAARKVEQAYVDQRYLKEPHCTLTVTVSPSRVSVLGEVKNPNRYPIDGRTTVLDVLALAGGRTDKGDDSVYLLRQEASGAVQRIKIDLRGIASQDDSVPEGVAVALRNGDRIYVPAASQYFVEGEVRKPESYRLEPGLTVQRAIALAGGVTDKGSTSRIEIKRPKPNGDYKVLSGKLNDKVQPGDVINVKERIF